MNVGASVGLLGGRGMSVACVTIGVKGFPLSGCERADYVVEISLFVMLRTGAGKSFGGK